MKLGFWVTDVKLLIKKQDSKEAFDPLPSSCRRFSQKNLRWEGSLGLITLRIFTLAGKTLSLLGDNPLPPWPTVSEVPGRNFPDMYVLLFLNYL